LDVVYEEKKDLQDVSSGIGNLKIKLHNTFPQFDTKDSEVNFDLTFKIKVKQKHQNMKNLGLEKNIHFKMITSKILRCFRKKGDMLSS
jgi:hypothetical protein